jgi:competence protein ComEA
MRKEVSMKNLMIRSVVLSVVFGLMLSFVFSLPALAAEKSSEKKININTASVAELQELPRIGEKVAQRIVDFRKTHGKFKKIEEIMKVQGIGEKIFLQIKDRITVG